MKLAEVVADGFGRIQEVVHEAVEGLSVEQLAASPAPGANTIAWLVWHLARVQDDHIADLMGTEQIWTAQGWLDRFALPFPAADIGYGHRPEDVDVVRVDSADLLTGYYDAVHEATTAWAADLDEAALDRIVDDAWDPPVTLGVRLVSVLSDDLQHAGQAAYLRGLVLRDT
ncbi:mycothiol transferase [Amycolatopsis sp. cmx-11-32]|uniref:mycothiol transferase n=1 Tax=Amycolatopsis sp. cmx-11-32 TaxID=2785796 RepID=UPI0039E4AF8E